MGSGKSSLGKGLAKKLNWPFVDSDREIERLEQLSIPAIFQSKGESYFRELEQKWINSLDVSTNKVIAIGGGMPCFFDNMDQLNAKGITIYLNRPVGELVYRLFHSKNPRPLVQGKSHEELSEFVRQTMDYRGAFYLKSKYTVSRNISNAQKLYDFIVQQQVLNLQ